MKKLAVANILAVVLIAFFTGNAFAEFYVIPVPDTHECDECEGTLSSGGRWCDNGNGTVTDMTTCLVWLKFADWGGQKSWRNDATSGETQYDDAHTRAGILASGETISPSGETPVYLDDDSANYEWRLPTYGELRSISEGSEEVSSSNFQLFEGIENGFYWTSSTVPSDSSKARLSSPYAGGASSANKDNENYVWPVRNAK